MYVEAVYEGAAYVVVAVSPTQPCEDCPVSEPLSVGGGPDCGRAGRSRFTMNSTTTRAMIASGHGNPNPPHESPISSSAASTPTTIRTVLRVDGLVLIAASSEPSSGMISHAAPYRSSPAPPKKTSTTKSTRRRVGSMLR